MPLNPATFDTAMLAVVFIFGACIGSFLNVVVWRMPRGLSIIYPPSHCPSCSRPIAWYDNLPLISWCVLRGRCRHCRTSISPRYLILEALTGLMLAGLYAAYFMLKVRRLGLGPEDVILPSRLHFAEAWPMFVAHGCLLCCLLACSMIDAKFFMIPLSVMWTAAVVGFTASVFRPHPLLAAPCSPVTVAAALAGGVGLCLAIYAQHRGWLIPSFIDAGGRPAEAYDRLAKASRPEAKEKTVGFTSDDGIAPRIEILREVVFLAPAIALAIGTALLLRFYPSINTGWAELFDASRHPVLGPRMACGGGSVVGFMAGGLWIWATRIIATFAFGREAMGLGDVHIMAGVGAVVGWAIPAMAFFLAPIFGLALALYMMLTGKGRELPYGPWLALGTLGAMLCYDRIVAFLGPGLTVIFGG